MSEGNSRDYVRRGPSGQLLVQHLALRGTEERPPERNRWIVLDEFKFEGFHYRLSRQMIDPKATQKGKSRLTQREIQALGYAQQGYSNKRIASTLGVAPSTVAVLLYRAAGKVGAKSRRDLLRKFARLELSAE